MTSKPNTFFISQMGYFELISLIQIVFWAIFLFLRCIFTSKIHEVGYGLNSSDYLNENLSTWLRA